VIATNPTRELARSYRNAQLRYILTQKAMQRPSNLPVPANYNRLPEVVDKGMSGCFITCITVRSGFRVEATPIKWDPVKDVAKIAADVVDFVGTALEGARKAVEGIGKSLIKSVKELGACLVLIARAAVGDVSWKEVAKKLGDISREIANIFVLANPIRLAGEILEKSNLTRHAFNELDKFTGGMLRTAINISTLPMRALRGDPITKEELLKTALFAVQVVALAIGGAVAAGIMVGGWVGREVCKKQTKMQNECMAAFQILGALVGDYATAAENALFQQSVNVATREAVNQCQKNKWTGSKECDFLGQMASAYVTSGAKDNWTDFLVSEAERVGTRVVLNKATELAQQACKEKNWSGDAECDALGNMLSKYILSSEPRKEWQVFLAEEAAAIGVKSLADRLIPKPPVVVPPEPNFRIVYADVVTPGETIVMQKSNTGAYIAAAAIGGAALLLLGGQGESV
jgi:hypothetical protein